MPARPGPRPSPRRGRPARKPDKAGGRRSGIRPVPVGVAVVLLGLALAWVARGLDRPRRLLERAEVASRSGDRAAARLAWREVNDSAGATARTWLAEARLDFALHRGRDAGLALERATQLDPGGAEAWRGRIDRLRLLDRPIEALPLGLLAARSVPPAECRSILAATTLAVLSDLPDDDARARLDRWIAADGDDSDARVARLARLAANPKGGDPDRAARIAELSRLLDRDPGHVPAREALVAALADAGDLDRGRRALEAWPLGARDARFDRLRARWDLDYDRRPDRAEAGYRRALAASPHDWRGHYGLARALRSLGRDGEARAEGEAVARLRERLDPAALGPRLAADLADPDLARGAADLARLCESAGLATLAEAWRLEARPRPAPGGR